MTQRGAQIVRNGIGKGLELLVGALQLGRAPFQGMLCVLASRDIAQNRGEEVSFRCFPIGDRNLYREFLSVPVSCDQLERFSDDSRLPGSEEPLEARLVLGL